jgi:hypothetical protein
MSIGNPKYDVAISFLSKDIATAQALHDKLSVGFNVFFFPRKQEDLAGTDGLASMREPFYNNSRLMLVLYREGWGETPWTRVEETAIKESCLALGYRRLFFAFLDHTASYPTWLPDTYVRFNYAEYGLEQAVGAIKARVQELGGQNTPLTAARRAEMLNVEKRYLADKARMNSYEGLKKIGDAVQRLFEEINRHCDDLNKSNRAHIRCEYDLAENLSVRTCVITDDTASAMVVSNQRWNNLLDDSGLSIRGFKSRVLLLSEMSNRMLFKKPEVAEEFLYLPELSIAREYGWKEEDKDDFLSSDALAEKCVILLLDLSSQAMNDRRAR